MQAVSCAYFRVPTSAARPCPLAPASVPARLQAVLTLAFSICLPPSLVAARCTWGALAVPASHSASQCQRQCALSRRRILAHPSLTLSLLFGRPSLALDFGRAGRDRPRSGQLQHPTRLRWAFVRNRLSVEWWRPPTTYRPPPTGHLFRGRCAAAGRAPVIAPPYHDLSSISHTFSFADHGPVSDHSPCTTHHPPCHGPL